MASEATSRGQEVIECNLCQEPVSFFCRRCGVNLCDPCVLIHLRLKTKFGHDVVDYTSKNDDDACLCASHPQNECSAFCKTCDIPICIICVSIKHKSHEISELHDKIEELLKDITRENHRLQSFKHKLERILDFLNKQVSSLSSFYQKTKEEVTARGEEWHRLIDSYVKKLHQELDDLKKESVAGIQEQKIAFAEKIGKIDEINMKSTKLQKSKDIAEIQKIIPVIKEQETMKEFTLYMFPMFHKCKTYENYLRTYFGCIEKMHEKKISLSENKSISDIIPDIVCVRKVLEVPSVSSVIDTGFDPADEESDNCPYDIAVTDDKKVWVGGYSTDQLKLFDLQGNLHRTVTIPCRESYICMHKKRVVFTDLRNNAVKKISDDDTVKTMFTTGDWEPYGITVTASGQLLVCLGNDDQSKVVRYSSTGTVLQEIQYDSQCQPLYQSAWYIAENVNGDIIVSDSSKREVITVDRLGIFRYSYSGQEISFPPSGVSTDSLGHVIVTDYNGDKIHMLDRDGRFLRYIIPDGGIKSPGAVCMIGDGEMIIKECLTGLAKRIKFLEEEKLLVYPEH